MKLCTLAVCLLFVGLCSAKEHDYQHGTLVSMDKLILRVPELNDKEREYVVVSMTPRELNHSADTTQKTASTQSASKN
jgi:hypothetical protein